MFPIFFFPSRSCTIKIISSRGSCAESLRLFWPARSKRFENFTNDFWFVLDHCAA
uniref:Uncharacterized protein n=1 Tax=Arundo donax TaxID=35708 RepID=A0A0A9E9I0_ARUDO